MIILVSGATATMRRYATDDRFGLLFVPSRLEMSRELSLDKPWAADNGAFAGFDANAFVKLLSRVRSYPRGLFVAAPDVVGDHEATVVLFRTWEPMIHALDLPVAFVLQDGVTESAVPWRSCEAVFIGGTTEFKLGRRAASIAGVAHALGKLVHMGRVNTKRRLRYATTIGCHSVDGTHFSRWPDFGFRKADRWLQEIATQPTLGL